MTIERWFVKGVRFTWLAPTAIGTQPKDGAIIDNPVIPAHPMHYDGMDSEIINMNSIVGKGFQKNMGVPHKWLSYVLGRTPKVSLAGQDVLTGFMSGCIIATWPEAGQRWVGHIGTVESAGKDQPPNSTVKTTFRTMIAGLPVGDRPNVRAYNPAAAWDLGEILAMLPRASKRSTKANVMSLTTTAGAFYSIVMIALVNEPGNWVCGGIKAVAGMDYNATVAALT